MSLFFCFIITIVLTISVLLFYNELILNNQILTKLSSELKILKEKIKCATSECVCDRAFEYKKEYENLNLQYANAKKLYEETYKKYKIQYKIVSRLAGKLNIAVHEENFL